MNWILRLFKRKPNPYEGMTEEEALFHAGIIPWIMEPQEKEEDKPPEPPRMGHPEPRESREEITPFAIVPVIVIGAAALFAVGAFLVARALF